MKVLSADFVASVAALRPFGKLRVAPSEVEGRLAGSTWEPLAQGRQA